MKKNILTTAFLMAIIASLGLFSVGCKKSLTKPKDTCEGVVMPNPYYKITSLKGVITDTTGKEKSNVVPEDYNKLCQYIYADKTQNLAIKKTESDFGFINSAYACSPMPPTAINGLIDVELVARKKFTYSGSADTIQVNDTITNLFVIKDESGFFSIDRYFEKNKNNRGINNLLLRLKERPNQPVTINYDIRARLYDGTNWTLPDITLKVK